jgi:hypothetical protein
MSGPREIAVLAQPKMLSVDHGPGFASQAWDTPGLSAWGDTGV